MHAFIQNCTESEESPDTSESFEPPEFIIRPKSLHITDVDKSAIFTCRVAGYPDPEVQWKHGSRTLTSGDKYKLSNSGPDFTLEILNPGTQDSGKYTCTASNSEGEVTATTNLNVREAIQSPAQTDFRSVLKPTKSPKPNSSFQNKVSEKVVIETESGSKFKPRDTSPKLNQNKLVQMDFRGVLKPHKQTDFRNVLKPVDRGRPGVKTLVKQYSKDKPDEFESDTDFDGGIKQTDFRRVLRSPTKSPTRNSFNEEIPSKDRQSPVRNAEDKRKSSQTSVVQKQQNGHSIANSSRNGSIHESSLSDSKNRPHSNDAMNYRSVLKQREIKDPKPSSQGAISDPTLDLSSRPGAFKGTESKWKSEQTYRTRVVSPLNDQAVQYGSQATLECRLDGAPQPDVHWFVNNKEIKQSKFFRMSFENNIAKLVIAEAYSEDEGEYKVMATNPAGTTSCHCELFVEDDQSTSENQSQSDLVSDGDVPVDSVPSLSPPKIYDLSPSNFSIARGDNLEIQASFCAVPNPEIRWYKNKTQIQRGERFEVESSEHFSKLIIRDAHPEDSSRYHLVVENELGSDMASTSLTVQDVPEPPVGRPSVSDVTKTSLALSWYGPAYDGGCPVTSYRVEVCDAEEQNWEVLTTTCKHTTFQVVGLQPKTPYFFRVSAQNRHGFSEPCQTSDVVVTSDCEKHSLRLLSTESDDEIPFEHREVQTTPHRVFEEHYHMQEEIGKGKFGSVYKCTDKATDKTWAAKIIKCREADKPKIRLEIEVMNQLKHPKILMLWDAFEASRKMILVMEFVGGGELFERVLDDDFELTERDCIQFMRQICDGVGYMHNKNILHLDLKPENILCVKNESNKIKIIDFGLARFYRQGESARVLFGTPEFIAPEVVNYEEIGFETDMWSLGVICYVLLSGLSPFMGDSDNETLSNVTLGEYDFEDDTFTDISDNAKDFIENLLVKRKKKRMTIQQCMSHKWLAQDVEKLQRKKISTKNLKRFMARRKWQKTGNAIRALGRITALQKGFRKDGVGGSSGERVAAPGERVTAPVNETGSQAVPPADDSVMLQTVNQSDSFSKVKDDTDHGDISAHGRFGGNLREKQTSNLLNNDASTNSISNARDKHHVTDSANHIRSSKSDLPCEVNSSKTNVEINSITNKHGNSCPANPTEKNNNDTKSLSKIRHSSNSGSLMFRKEMVDCKAFTGDVVRFDVAVSSQEPDIEITWYFEDEELLPSPRHVIQHGEHGDCSLIIRDVSEDDDGIYTCIARNRSGEEIECSSELIVYGAI